MLRTKRSGKGMLNPHITQTIKEIFRQSAQEIRNNKSHTFVTAKKTVCLYA
jgi:hypothetical protein